MKVNDIRRLLKSRIKKVAAQPELYSFNPKKDFSRNRKLPPDKLITMMIGMNGGSLTNELLGMTRNSPATASSSAFVQQRSKLKPTALEDIFRSFSLEASGVKNKNLPILAIDGSDLHIYTNPEDKSTYHPGVNRSKPFNLLHLNALYDLSERIYLDAVVQGRRDENEHKALCEMVDRSPLKKALLIADRGYESYNSMAHLQEKGWFFLIRIKDSDNSIKGNLVLPQDDEFDITINLNITRKQSKEMKELFADKNHYRFMPSTSVFDYLPVKSSCRTPAVFYKLNFRVVRFVLSEGVYETVLTNLDPTCYPPERLKKLYAMRWGIETSFRDLKYTVGLIHFHSKKVMHITQEIFASLIMYNFTELINALMIVQNESRKYASKTNFSVSVHVCRAFFLGDMSPPDLEAVIRRYLVPIRPDRHCDRNLSGRHFVSFSYRLA